MSLVIPDDILTQTRMSEAEMRQEIAIYIKTLATHPDYTGRGVARSLYRFLYGQFPHSVMSVGV